MYILNSSVVSCSLGEVTGKFVDDSYIYAEVAMRGKGSFVAELPIDCYTRYQVIDHLPKAPSVFKFRPKLNPQQIIAIVRTWVRLPSDSSAFEQLKNEARAYHEGSVVESNRVEEAEWKKIEERLLNDKELVTRCFQYLATPLALFQDDVNGNREQWPQLDRELSDLLVGLYTSDGSKDEVNKGLKAAGVEGVTVGNRNFVTKVRAQTPSPKVIIEAFECSRSK